MKMTNEEVLKKNGGERFSIALGNPPYDRSLHLKFLEKTIQLADKVVFIQPIRWLEETIGRDKKNSAYNKYENSISKHIKDLEIISAEEAKNTFGILLPTNVGIYLCDENGGFDYKGAFENSIIEKVISYIKDNKCNLEMNKKDGWRVRVPFISGGRAVGSGERAPSLGGFGIKNIVFKDGKHKGKWWYEYYMKNQHSKTTEEITSSIRFDSEEEGYNFINTFKTDFVRYIEDKLIVDVHIDNSKILWMGNAKNPRTDKIGYKSEWTDEDFNKFFDLTKDEVSIYKDFMAKYKNERADWHKKHGKIDSSLEFYYGR